MSKRSDGFTLIELSIVLVIIGLIAGGVLVGSDLIAASKVRAQIGDIQMLDTAANTFRAKYNCVPGDCINGDVLFTYPVGANFQKGNGDKLVKSGTGPTSNNFTGEPIAFFNHLHLSGLVERAPLWINGEPANVGTQLFPTRYGHTALALANMYGLNGYYLGLDSDYDAAHAGGGGTSSFTAYGLREDIFIPIEALSIDSKMDDGKPFTGKVKATRRNGGDANKLISAYHAGHADCSSPTEYNTVTTTKACRIWIRADF